MAGERARRLRRGATPDERLLRRRLRKAVAGDLHFRRQVPLGGCCADFAGLQGRPVVELDGSHHDTDFQSAHDAVRGAAFAAAGVAALRFRDADARKDPDRSANAIIMEAGERREALPRAARTR